MNIKKMNRDEIKKIIPHREPFLLIDEIVEVEQGKKIKAVKHVSDEEYYFKGHFPSNPIMPGVLIVETIAQAGAVLALMMPENKGKIVLFAGIDKVRFKKIVRPGDELILDVELENLKRNIGKAKGRATVRDEVVCTAEILFALTQ
ncbi:MAG: 3-hydroxyacyl-ACP dehydratase FabZ [Candidatus Humimicrobiaceae bacterium]|jgi:3-hydroxyacyl-[acyl-carrier-protein] dehydratase|nr:3-hydroxyacyl-ACP dehydratase FabZ [Candidatus Humimicrobiaceae bacterium]